MSDVSKKYTVDYGSLKKILAKSTIRNKEKPTKFKIDAEKVKRLLDNDNIEVILLNSGLTSEPLRERDIPFLSVYFKDSKLEWMDISSGKEFTTIVFVNKKNLDEECLNLIEKLKIPGDQIDIDRGKVLAAILAKYPCYIAQIVSYRSNNPDFNKTSSYTIAIRANTITIKDDNYRYNEQDID